MFGPLEKDVMFVLAVPDFETNVGVLGMPTYDQHKKLLGFYRDEQGADGVTRTVLKGSPRFPPPPTPLPHHTTPYTTPHPPVDNPNTICTNLTCNP